MPVDPGELVALVSLTVDGDDSVAELERRAPLARDLGAFGLDAVGPAGGADSPTIAVTMHVRLGHRVLGNLRHAAAEAAEAAEAAGPLLERFGWRPDHLRARWSPEYRDHLVTETEPGPRAAGPATELSVMTWASLVRGLRDGLDGDEAVHNAGRCRRFLPVIPGTGDTVLRAHALVAAPDLVVAAARLRSVTGVPAASAVGLDVDQERVGLVHGALVYVVAGTADTRQVATAAADRFGIADHPYQHHRVRQWEVGAVEAPPDGAMPRDVTVHAVYARRGVEPFADFGVFPIDGAQDLILSNPDLTEDDALSLRSAIEHLLADARDPVEPWQGPGPRGNAAEP